MRQLVAERGRTVLVEVEPPPLRPGGYLVRTEWTLISPGTELDLVQRSAAHGGRESLGYSLVGTVIAAGAAAPPLAPGTRLACSGIQFSPHAELASVPFRMAAVVPAGVPAKAAAFTTLGALALHALRQGQVQLGETVVVLGLGVVGQLLAQVVRAAGARVAVFDPLERRQALAVRLGAEQGLSAGRLAEEVHTWTGGLGADCVFLCTRGGQGVVETACALARDRGTLVVVGTPRLELPRDPLFMKELQLRTVRAYGPGRYDPRYEEEGSDYPVGYVRWTLQRNLAEFLRLLDRGLVQVEPLITHELPFRRAAEAHPLLRERPAEALGVLLAYGEEEAGAARQPADPPVH
jgi:threonine dehydrogenase-like Zn-dependent dehydrogenase